LAGPIRPPKTSPAEEDVRAVARMHLVPELLVQRKLLREQVCG
jgi:hypothetical protein